MLALLDIRFSFICRTTFTNENGKHPIILRIIFRGSRKDIFTGLSCLKELWNSQNGRVHNIGKEAAALNKNLDHILRKANDAFDALRFSDEQFTIDELIEKIKGKDQAPQFLVEYLQKRNEDIFKRVGIEITKATYYKYRRSLQYMQEFLLKRYQQRNYTLKKITTTFLEEYFHFLRAEKNISHNVARRYLEFLKTIILPAIRSGEIKINPFQDLKIRPKPVIRQFLTQDEIDKLAILKTGDPDLERKKDIFLFSCFTGLAYIDIKEFKKEHLSKESDGTWFIRKPRQKTGEESIIPLLPVAVKILQKHSPTGDIKDFNWYVSTNQKMNQGLKFIGKRAGISKILHMHLARHTFATTVTLSNGVPIESVSKMLGHANLRQTQHYAKVVALKIKNDMERLKSIYQ